jgi:hypothetical protein
VQVGSLFDTCSIDMRLVTAIEERLRAAGVAAPDVAAEVVPALERTPAGKLKLVVIDEEQRVPA